LIRGAAFNLTAVSAFATRNGWGIGIQLAALAAAPRFELALFNEEREFVGHGNELAVLGARIFGACHGFSFRMIKDPYQG
jgi:hypothetical protein